MHEREGRPASEAERVRYAKVLVELGCLLDAEHEVAEVLYASPDDGDALALLTKIKHMKGELSSAIAGWSELHARAQREAPNARIRLAALLHLAQGPPEPAPALVEVVPPRALKKPVAYAELEQAFRAWLSQRPAEARARCRLFALRVRGSDAELYKLAVLAEAWMAEQAGDLVSARALLEELGKERAFAADLDRVLALAPLYERIGTHEALEAAAHIYGFLARSTRSFMANGHLADLYRKLGDDARARAAEHAHVVEFRARMLRPDLRDAADVGARRYLPLPLLMRAALPDDGSDPPEKRGRAIALALRGALSEARRSFEREGELLDEKYLVDLCALEGDVEGSLRRALAAAREDPTDLWLVFQLLDYAREHEQHEEVRAHFREGQRADAAREALASRLEADPRDVALWRRLGTLDALAPASTRPPRARQASTERASALEEAGRSRGHAVGRALAASVYAFPGGAREGLIHEIWAGREPVEPATGGTLADEHIFGNLTPEMHKDVKSTFLAVREYARAKLPHRTADLMDYRYTYKVTKEDEPSGGASAGLPTALAFLSLFTGEPLPQDLAATGRIVTDAHDVLTVHGIGDVAYKMRAACHRNLRALLAPSMNRAELLASPLVPRAVSLEQARFVATFDDAVRVVFGPGFFA